jgi:hypothetical protein
MLTFGHFLSFFGSDRHLQDSFDGSISFWRAKGARRWRMSIRFGRTVDWLLLAASVAVCTAQAPLLPADTSGAAKVLTLTGQVSVMRDSQPWALVAGDLVQLQQVIITGPDGFAIFQVSDGSTFEVFPSSQVIFRKTPGNWKDLLDVIIGRVKVQIQKWGGQPNFNRVMTPSAVISVRGTVFHVEVEDGDATTLVVVDEGQVEVLHARHPGAPKLLNAGEWLRVYKNQPIAARLVEKSTVLNAAFRAVADALYTIVYRNGRIPTVAGRIPGGGGTPLPGDGGGGAPPPPLPGDNGGGTPPPPPPPGK